MKNIERIFEGNYCLDNVPLKLFLSNGNIYLPVKINCEYIHEDGLCFGYPGDEGYFTSVEYTPAFGILADDIKTYLQEIKEIQGCLKAVKKPSIHDFFYIISINDFNGYENIIKINEINDHEYYKSGDILLSFYRSRPDSSFYYEELRHNEDYYSNDDAFNTYVECVKNRSELVSRIKALKKEIILNVRILQKAMLDVD